jgi:hypothetical protein
LPRRFGPRKSADNAGLRLSQLEAAWGLERRRAAGGAGRANRGGGAALTVLRTNSGQLESIFLPDSFGYRPKKSALDAIAVTRDRCWRYKS